jgi:hypothetical protein
MLPASAPDYAALFALIDLGDRDFVKRRGIIRQSA